MIRQTIPWSCSGVLILVVMLAACSTCAVPTPTIAITTPSPPMASRTPTTTATPTMTASPTPALPTLAPITMPPAAPTLTAEQEAAFVAEMMATNGGCEIPCWWGIIPGESEYHVVQESFSSQGLRLSGDPPWILFALPDNEKPDYHVSVSFGVTDDIVTSIQVESQMVGKSSESVEHFAQNWHSYAWEQIMTQYGRPSQVVFATDPPIERDAPGYYGVTLIYEPLGFAVSYIGPAQLTADFSTMRACPIFNKVLFIRLYLVSAEDSVTTHLRKLMGTDGWPLLEEETGMSVDTFYETFKEADSDVCLEQRIVAP